MALGLSLPVGILSIAQMLTLFREGDVTEGVCERRQGAFHDRSRNGWVIDQRELCLTGTPRGQAETVLGLGARLTGQQKQLVLGRCYSEAGVRESACGA